VVQAVGDREGDLSGIAPLSVGLVARDADQLPRQPGGDSPVSGSLLPAQPNSHLVGGGAGPAEEAQIEALGGQLPVQLLYSLGIHRMQPTDLDLCAARE
jgi:hypothetical protein